MLLDGRKAAHDIRMGLQKKLTSHSSTPHLVVFLTYPDPASQIYVTNKIKACQEVGIRVTLIETPFISTDSLKKAIDLWNYQDDVDGILIQFPVHPEVDQYEIMKHVNPEKDVDGTHPINLGKLLLSDPSGLIPCTPLGIQTLLSTYAIPTEGKHVVIVGRSATVGKPLAMLLSQKTNNANATVTLAHRATHNLSKICQSADILVAAAGCPGVLTKEMIRKGSVVIDVGINRIQTSGTSQLVGDVICENIEDHSSAYTPVPGGVGPMTIASLLSNTVKTFLRKT